MVKNDLGVFNGRWFSGFGKFFFRKEGYSSFLLQGSKIFVTSSFLGINIFLFLALCFSTSTAIIRLFVSNVYFIWFYGFIFFLFSSTIIFFKKMGFFFFFSFSFFFKSLYCIRGIFFVPLLITQRTYYA